MSYSKNELLALYDDPVFYDAEFCDRDFEIDFYLKQSMGKQSVLELACGTGRITIPLRKAGIDISGIDISESMIGKAKENAQAENLEVNFYHQDACDFEGHYDLIFMATNAFQHILNTDDALNCLQSCYRSLSPGGTVIIDIQVPDIELLARDLSIEQPYKEFFFEGKLLRAFISGHYSSFQQIYYFTIRYFHEGKLEKEKKVAMRMYYPQEIKMLFRLAGFTVEKLYQSYDGNSGKVDHRKQIYMLTS